MAFTAKDVQNLRERTGCGMMDCKKALTEAGGDMEKAIELLREKGLAAQAKKSGRIAAEGIVYTYVDEEKKVGVVIEVNAETDFVAKNDSFQSFVASCAKAVAEQNPATVEELMTCKADDQFTVEEALREKILTIGENMKIRRFARYEGEVVTYSHGGGRIGVLVEVNCETDFVAKTPQFKALVRDIAMHIAASNPTCVRPEELDPAVLEHEKEILRAQALNEGKPEKIVDKMVEGRIHKYIKEVCLLEQPFVKDGDKSIKGLMAEVAKATGANLDVVRFARFERGEGIEKRQDNFAEEIAAQMKKA